MSSSTEPGKRGRSPREQGRQGHLRWLEFPETASVSGKFRRRDRGVPDHVGPAVILVLGALGPSQLRGPGPPARCPSGTPLH